MTVAHVHLRTVIEALPGKDKPGGGRMARCPVHDDRHASLSIDFGQGGELLLSCHAGCRTEDIVATLGGTMADLFPEPAPNGRAQGVRVVRRRRTASAGDRAFDAWYTDGTVAGQHHRQDDGSGTKRIWWDPRGVEIARLALFGSRGLTGDGPVVVVEGERATLAVRAAGLDAVGTWGSNATPSDAALEPLRGRDIVLWADDDDPGRQAHGRHRRGARGRCARRQATRRRAQGLGRG